MKRKVHTLNKDVSDKEKIINDLKMLMSKQEMQPNDEVVSDQKQQADNDLSEKDERMRMLKMDLDAERQRPRDYHLQYAMTAQVRFACTQ
jgi:hypothetical protein